MNTHKNNGTVQCTDPTTDKFFLLMISRVQVSICVYVTCDSGHTAGCSLCEDQQCHCSSNPNATYNWRWPSGRPGHTWLTVVKDDLKPLNVSLAAAWRN